MDSQRLWILFVSLLVILTTIVILSHLKYKSEGFVDNVTIKAVSAPDKFLQTYTVGTAINSMTVVFNSYNPYGYDKHNIVASTTGDGKGVKIYSVAADGYIGRYQQVSGIGVPADLRKYTLTESNTDNAIFLVKQYGTAYKFILKADESLALAIFERVYSGSTSRYYYMGLRPIINDNDDDDSQLFVLSKQLEEGLVEQVVASTIYNDVNSKYVNTIVNFNIVNTPSLYLQHESAASVLPQFKVEPIANPNLMNFKIVPSVTGDSDYVSIESTRNSGKYLITQTDQGFIHFFREKNDTYSELYPDNTGMEFKLLEAPNCTTVTPTSGCIYLLNRNNIYGTNTVELRGSTNFADAVKLNITINTRLTSIGSSSSSAAPIGSSSSSAAPIGSSSSSAAPIGSSSSSDAHIGSSSSSGVPRIYTGVRIKYSTNLYVTATGTSSTNYITTVAQSGNLTTNGAIHFKIVPGLTGALNTVSIESELYPDYYITLDKSIGPTSQPWHVGYKMILTSKNETSINNNLRTFTINADTGTSTQTIYNIGFVASVAQLGIVGETTTSPAFIRSYYSELNAYGAFRPSSNCTIENYTPPVGSSSSSAAPAIGSSSSSMARIGSSSSSAIPIVTPQLGSSSSSLAKQLASSSSSFSPIGSSSSSRRLTVEPPAEQITIGSSSSSSTAAPTITFGSSSSERKAFASSSSEILFALPLPNKQPQPFGSSSSAGGLPGITLPVTQGSSSAAKRPTSTYTGPEPETEQSSQTIIQNNTRPTSEYNNLRREISELQRKSKEAEEEATQAQLVQYLEQPTDQQASEYPTTTDSVTKDDYNPDAGFFANLLAEFQYDASRFLAGLRAADV
jgi:hypothetical protein